MVTAYKKPQENEDNSYLAQELILEYHRQAQELLEQMRSVIGNETVAIPSEQIIAPPSGQADDDNYSVEEILSLTGTGSVVEIENVLSSMFTSIEASILRDKAKAKKHEEFLHDFVTVIENNFRQQNLRAAELQNISSRPEEMAVRHRAVELGNTAVYIEKSPTQASHQQLQQNLTRSLNLDYQQVQQAHQQLQTYAVRESAATNVQLAIKAVTTELVKQAELTREVAKQVISSKPEQAAEKVLQVQNLVKTNIAATEQLKQQPGLKPEQVQVLEKIVVERAAIVQQLQPQAQAHFKPVVEKLAPPVTPPKDSTSIPKQQLEKIVEKLVKPIIAEPKPVIKPEIKQIVTTAPDVAKRGYLIAPPSKPEKPHICGSGCPDHSAPSSKPHIHSGVNCCGSTPDIKKMASEASRVEKIEASGARWNAPPKNAPKTNSASLQQLADLILAA